MCQDTRQWCLRSILISVIILTYDIGTVLSQIRQADTIRLITLDEVVYLAGLNNLEVKMARQDSALAAQQVLDAKMARTPYIGSGVNYNYIGDPVLYRDFYSNDTSIGYFNHQAGWNVGASIPIYTGGAIQTQIEQEQVTSQIRNEVLKMTEAQVKLMVINQFYNLYKLYRQAEIILENIRNVKINIRQLESRVANGQNIISDLTRTELQLSNFEIDVFRTWNNIDLLSNYLCIFTGIPSSTRLQPIEVVVEIPGDTLDYQTCLQEAFTNRYELKQAEFQKQYSELALRKTKSGLYPVISGTAIYSSEFPVPGTFPPQSDILNYWAVGVGLKYNISSLYDLSYQKQSDKIQIEKETINIEYVKNEIDQELKTAFIHFIESKKNIESYRKNVELAMTNYKIIKSKYDNEFALIIDMIDAELQVNDAKLSLNNAIIDAINQYYNLIYSMGKLN
jgi:outer membrane protein